MKTLTLTTTARDRRIACLAALAICIHIFEAAIPSPFPGMKPGLANVIVVVTMLLYGWRDAAWVSLLRVLVGSLLIGTFLSPTFLMSLSGAVSSLIMLTISYRLFSDHLSAVGYSVLAALAHMTAQFCTAWLVFIPHPGLVHLLPIFMTMALLFGTLSGIIAGAMINQVRRS